AATAWAPISRALLKAPPPRASSSRNPPSEPLSRPVSDGVGAGSTATVVQPEPTVLIASRARFASPGDGPWWTGSVPSVTFVAGGGLKENCAAGGTSKLTE